MNRQEQIIEVIREQKLLPLFYHGEAETCIKTVKALYAAGIRAIEFTNRGASALENFRSLVNEKSSLPELLIGVGTVTTAGQANEFILSGADFLVSPVFCAEVADVAYLNKILFIPGCMTPTEIHVAEKSGCRLIKLFPGNVLGPGYVTAVRAIFPGLSFMPTGGVKAEEENLNEWFKAGVCAVGMGSDLITRKILEKKDFDKLTKQTQKILKMIRKF